MTVSLMVLVTGFVWGNHNGFLTVIGCLYSLDYPNTSPWSMHKIVMLISNFDYINYTCS